MTRALIIAAIAAATLAGLALLATHAAVTGNWDDYEVQP